MATPEILGSDTSSREEGFRAKAFAEPPALADSFKSIHLDLPIFSIRYRVLKRLLDLAIVAVAIPIALPLGLLLALLVRITSTGSALYRHRRIGQFHQPVYVWKFRTMYEDSDEALDRHLDSNPKAREEWSRAHKLRDDPRVTPIGRMLRKTSMDEIPQLLNVLAGDMSIVGPRPIVDEEREKYGEHFRTYTQVLPGITGLWQVSGRCDVDYPARVQLDVHYVENWSLWMETKILFKTTLVILRNGGAY